MAVIAEIIRNILRLGRPARPDTVGPRIFFIGGERAGRGPVRWSTEQPRRRVVGGDIFTTFSQTGDSRKWERR
jgi:hypothetical protein